MLTDLKHDLTTIQQTHTLVTTCGINHLSLTRTIPVALKNEQYKNKMKKQHSKSLIFITLFQ